MQSGEKLKIEGSNMKRGFERSVCLATKRLDSRTGLSRALFFLAGRDEERRCGTRHEREMQRRAEGKVYPTFSFVLMLQLLYRRVWGADPRIDSCGALEIYPEILFAASK
jgi:hypothetical protein